MKIKEIGDYFNNSVPQAYQENYDNTGLLIGNPETEIKKILLTLDCTEEVIEEAIREDCNLIVAHHPVIFKGIKKLTGTSYTERTVAKAIKNDIAVYAAHTNLDNVHTGMNKKIADIIGLKNTQILQPKKQLLKKITVFIPEEAKEAVINATYTAGAGKIGDYEDCSFSTTGTGTFKPGRSATPHIGKPGIREEVTEYRTEMIFSGHLESSIIKAVTAAHPYEEPAYYITSLENEFKEVGSGMTGELETETDAVDFLNELRQKMNLEVIRHTAINRKKIKKVAVCGGSGSYLLPIALRRGIELFITADFKYHEFFDAENRLIIADIGHYESEVSVKALFYELLSEKFPNIALVLSQVNTNPINYLYGKNNGFR